MIFCLTVILHSLVKRFALSRTLVVTALFIHTAHLSLQKIHLISVRHTIAWLTIILWSLWHSHLSHQRLCQTYKVTIDSTSFIWMGVYNASLHPLDSVESILIELHYTVHYTGNLVNIRARQAGSDLMGPQGSLAYLFVLTTCDDNFNAVCPRCGWKECW